MAISHSFSFGSSVAAVFHSNRFSETQQALMTKTMIWCVCLFPNNTENLIALVKANAGQDEAELGQSFVRIFVVLSA